MSKKQYIQLPDYLVYFHESYDRWYPKEEIRRWLEDNEIVYEQYTDLFNTAVTVFFRNEDDAVLFKLRWFG